MRHGRAIRIRYCTQQVRSRFLREYRKNETMVTKQNGTDDNAKKKSKNHSTTPPSQKKHGGLLLAFII
jgi:hypothetical protein